MNLFSKIKEPLVVPATLEVLTPMFLGGPAPRNQAQWRAQSLKGALRFWWRVAYGYKFGSATELFDHEAVLFGAAGEKGENYGRSLVKIIVPSRHSGKIIQIPSSSSKIAIKTRNGRTFQMPGTSYLVGQGLLDKGKCTRPDLPAKEHLDMTLEINGDENQRLQIQTALALFLHWGSLGSRQRHGFGSFQAQSPQFEIDPNVQPIKPWEKGLDKDYPHGFGCDNRGLLAWQVDLGTNAWAEALGRLGVEWYGIRRHFKLQTSDYNQKLPERLVVGGLPMIRHKGDKAPWTDMRHGSLLRLTLRKDGQGNLVGRFYLLPHSLPGNLVKKDDQKNILTKLITFLDNKKWPRLTSIFS